MMQSAVELVGLRRGIACLVGVDFHGEEVFRVREAVVPEARVDGSSELAASR